jgi:hypothetical protein
MFHSPASNYTLRIDQKIANLEGKYVRSANNRRDMRRLTDGLVATLWAIVRARAGLLAITDLACSEEEQQRRSRSIGDGMQLGVQAAFRASDAAGKSTFLSRLAAILWALRCAASIISRSGLRDQLIERHHLDRRLFGSRFLQHVSMNHKTPS